MLGSGTESYQMACGKSLNLSDPHFHHLQNWISPVISLDLENPVKFGCEHALDVNTLPSRSGTEAAAQSHAPKFCLTLPLTS